MNKKTLPDINESLSSYQYSLEKVGMEKIEMPILIKKENESHLCQANLDVYVNLIGKSKGIHMSRLYLILNEALAMQEFSSHCLLELHKKLSSSQKNISSTSFLTIRLNYPYKRNSLISDHSAYRFYPLTIESSFNQKINKFFIKVGLEILYSSTCPCSATLSEEVIKEKFFRQMKQKEIINFTNLKEILQEETILSATPHAQRSLAKINFTYNQKEFNFEKLERSITEIENVIKTPVQTIVKRQDEQEFARLNGENLMFCEDACRIILNYFKQNSDMYDKFSITVTHKESLHAHNAVAKGSYGSCNN